MSLSNYVDTIGCAPNIKAFSRSCSCNGILQRSVTYAKADIPLRVSGIVLARSAEGPAAAESDGKMDDIPAVGVSWGALVMVEGAGDGADTSSVTFATESFTGTAGATPASGGREAEASTPSRWLLLVLMSLPCSSTSSSVDDVPEASLLALSIDDADRAGDGFTVPSCEDDPSPTVPAAEASTSLVRAGGCHDSGEPGRPMAGFWGVKVPCS